MWDEEQFKKEELALDQQKIDHLTHLAIWGAPWQKAWLELAMLERHWDGNTIGRMIDERLAYPDYSEKVTTPYPQAGWLADLLQSTEPDSMSSQLFAMLIGNMADGLSQDMKIAMKNMEPEKVGPKSKQVEAIFLEAIAAFTSYVPRGLDEGGLELHSSSMDLVIRSLKLALSTHYIIRGSVDQAEQTYPGIAQLADPEHSKAAISEMVDRTLSSIKNNLEMAQIELPLPDEDCASQYPGVETENDDNPKHLIWCASEDYFSHNNTTAALDKWRKAMKLVGNFIDENGDIEEEKLADSAGIFAQTPYTMPLIGGISQTAWCLLDMNSFDLARRYLLLDQALKARVDAPNPPGHGFTKALGEMLDHRSMGRALTGINRFDEAEHHLLAAIEIAELHGISQDVTGRKIEAVVLSELEILYWILLNNAGRTAEAEKLWQKFLGRETSIRAMQNWTAERKRVGDLQSLQIVQAKLSSSGLDI